MIHHMQDTIPDNFNEDKYGVIIINEIQLMSGFKCRSNTTTCLNAC